MTPVFFVKTTESHVKTTQLYEVCRLGHHIDSTFTGKDQNGPNQGGESRGFNDRAKHGFNDRTKHVRK